jgi:hypothetical protein
MDGHRQGWASPLPRAWGDRLRVLALPVLLVTIATFSTHRAVSLDQSSWQGASFGMFATYENDVSRSVRVWADGPNGRFRVRLPDGLQDDATRLRVTPTEGAARSLAAAVLAGAPTAAARAVEVEVWRIHVSTGADLRLRTELLVAGRAER